MEAAIRGIAEELDMGMVCFFNPDTLEMESVPGASYGSFIGKYMERWTVGKIVCALTRLKHGSPLKSWKASSRSVFRTIHLSGNSCGTQ